MSADLDLAGVEWVKSSYSDANGGDCIEFSRDFAWVKSSYSGGDGGQCIEFSPDLAWIKSSHSDANAGQCIEFSPALTQVHGVVPVRDSKNPDGPTLVFPAGGWSSFVSAVQRGEFAV